jgi:hypothetical protein
MEKQAKKIVARTKVCKGGRPEGGAVMKSKRYPETTRPEEAIGFLGLHLENIEHNMTFLQLIFRKLRHAPPPLIIDDRLKEMVKTWVPLLAEAMDQILEAKKRLNVIMASDPGEKKEQPTSTRDLERELQSYRERAEHYDQLVEAGKIAKEDTLEYHQDKQMAQRLREMADKTDKEAGKWRKEERQPQPKA